jgi:hypothetical protein
MGEIVEQKEVPIDLLELVEDVKEVIDGAIQWDKCQSKLAWSKSSYKDGSGKEKVSMFLTYTVPSDHPNAVHGNYQLKFKVDRDRTIEFWFKELFIEPYFSINVSGFLSESQLGEIPRLVGKYLDIKTSGVPEDEDE